MSSGQNVNWPKCKLNKMSIVRTLLIIDKSAAKYLGKEENSKINFTEFTKFFKEFYTNI